MALTTDATPGRNDAELNAPSGLKNAARALEFWGRATQIYASYKLTQMRAGIARMQGSDEDRIRDEIWVPQHTWAGQKMYELCVSLRGFYLKAGQFIGARGDFVPEQVCRELTSLQDRVPPMSPDKAKLVIQRELGIQDLNQVFEWIDLDSPIGSASIAQVHKAQLKRFPRSALREVQSLEKKRLHLHVVQPGEEAWDIANAHGVSLANIQKLNKGLSLQHLEPGSVLKLPMLAGLEWFRGTSGAVSSGNELASLQGGAQAAVLHAVASGDVPEDGLVAVKVQYPDAMGMMTEDLVNLRAAADFLSRTEIRFDLVSAVDELNKQIRLEFDFTREARVMDAIAENLRPARKRIVVPQSVHGLVTRRVLVMHFIDGTPLMSLGDRLEGVSERQRAIGKRRVLSNISEAYGRMILGDGLFQADGHPGNILVLPGGAIGLLDYGQSKQLPDNLRLLFAQLLLEMSKASLQEGKNLERVSAVLNRMGIVTESDCPAIRTEMGFGMFDTTLKVDPFSPNSPIKKSAITSFPQDMFFVLRVIQLLRGIATGMGMEGYSTAQQWLPYARKALRGIQVEPLTI